MQSSRIQTIKVSNLMFLSVLDAMVGQIEEILVSDVGYVQIG